MLTDDDALLAERDPALPGLATVLDPEAVAERTPGAIGAVATYVRYKPSTSCLVGYRFATSAGPVLGFAKAFREDDRAKLQKARQREAPDSELGWGVVTLDPGTVVVALARSDRDLPGLRALTSPTRSPDAMARLLPQHPDLWSRPARPLRYKPERRWVGVVERDGIPVALIKAYRGGGEVRPRRGQARARAVTARPLGHSRRLAATASAWVPGPSLTERLNDPVSVDAVARTLGRLHATPPGRHLPRHDGPPEGLALGRAAAAVASLLPGEAHAAARLADELRSRLAYLPAASSLVHGDFSADQVVLAAARAVLIDLDEAGLGHPAMDLASFAADLDRRVIAGHLDPRRAEALVDALVDGYPAGDSGPLRSQLAPRRAAALLRLAVEPFRRRSADWAQQAVALLRRAEELT